MKKLIVAAASLLALNSIQAQDIGQILAGSQADANKYLQSYLEPFGKGEIMNMGRGWFNTGRTHKRLGFDITVNAQLAVVPQGNRFFNFNNADYQTFRLKSSASSATVSNFLGDKTTQTISVSTTVNGHNVSYEFNTPEGIGKDMKDAVGFVAVPLPVAQIGVGVFKNTDVKLRYFPKTNFGDVGVGVFGLAVQHEFLKKIPFLHLSALAGYNTTNVDYNLKNSNIKGSNQRAEVKLSAFTIQGIASVKLLFFEVYTALGYTTGSSDANLKGTYQIDYTDNNTHTTYSNTVVDPIALKYKNSGLSNTWGLRMNVFFFKVFADYTFANYNGAGAGVSFSFR